MPLSQESFVLPMSDYILQYVVLISPGILLISIVLSLIHWKRLPIAFQKLLAYLIWNLMVETIVYFLPDGTNNLPLLHLHTLIEFILFTWLYEALGLFGDWRRQLFYGYVIGIPILILSNSLFVQSIYSYNTFSRTFVLCILIAYAVGYFLQLHSNRQKRRAHDVMNGAILLFYAGSLFVFMFGNILMDNEYANSFWLFNLVLNILFQVLILLSIWLASKDKKSPFLSHSES